MKNCYSFFLLLLLAAGCSTYDASEIRLKNRFCTWQLTDNNEFFRRMMRGDGKSQNPRIFRPLNDAKSLISLRENYYLNRSRAQLSIYADTIINRLRVLKNPDPEILDQISLLKEKVHHKRDTVAMLDALYWTLLGERLLLEYLASQTCCGDYFDVILPSFVSKANAASGDTVLLSLSTEFTRFNDGPSFSNITCQHEKGSILVPRIWQAGPVYTLVYIPKEKGRYVIEGKICMGDPSDHACLAVHNEFIVE